MSWAIVARVFKTKVGSPARKAVLLTLANYCDDAGESCFPGQETIKRDTELSADTIQRQVKALTAAGFVSGVKRRRKGHWASWNYKINLSMLWHDQAAPCGTVDTTEPAEPAAPCGTARPHHAARPSRTMRHKPSTKPFNKPSRAKPPSRPDGLGDLGARLRSRIGRDKFDAWFAGATVVGSTDHSVTVEMPSKMFASHAAQNFEADVLACCRAQQSTIERVRFVARAA